MLPVGSTATRPDDAENGIDSTPGDRVPGGEAIIPLVPVEEPSGGEERETRSDEHDRMIAQALKGSHPHYHQLTIRATVGSRFEQQRARRHLPVLLVLGVLAQHQVLPLEGRDALKQHRPLLGHLPTQPTAQTLHKASASF